LPAKRSSLLVAIPKSNLHQRDYRVIALLHPLELQQIIVSAPSAIGESPADSRASQVNGALPRPGIEKLTSLPENRISFASQDPFVIVSGRKTPDRRINVNAEMIRQPLYVAARYLDPLIDRTAVGGTL